ncbi:calreticulin family protein [Teladorsagia circumcincta]|uniref:Calreticulin family protein n=1 Tax=Teladorsagia circumcincta TaxID=45464 RepID=A0A2G9V395_TELCI|nr:calreticulin family protein [Teladorsagia circumcincta]
MSETVFAPSTFVPPKLSSKPLFFDYFPTTDEIGKRWIPSTAKKDGVDSEIAKYNGKWEIGPSSEVSIEGDYGLIVRTKARHHAIAAKLDKPFSFADKPLVVQYEVRYEEGQECGGGYLKLLSVGAEKNLAAVQDKTPYTIMFGPDKCGPTGKVHLIFRYKNPKNNTIDEYHAKQPSNIGSTYWDDHQTHLYTLVVKPDGAFSVSVDQKQMISGNMLNDLVPSLQPPKEIADPNDKKPSDWDDRAEIEDENAVKPDDWDESQPSEVVDENAVKPSDWLEDEPELIPDPEASKPSDWDDDMDGDWEPPMIDNPACKGVSGCGQWKKPLIPNPLYKGKWVRPRIANPAYRGVWTPRQIENPHYFEPKPFEGLAPITAIGIELWTMSQNIIFDNILVCESEDLAAEVAKQTYTLRRAEDARLASSQGKGSGIVQDTLRADQEVVFLEGSEHDGEGGTSLAGERPWLWVVYVLCVLIPIILIGVCCFGRKSNADYAADRKKTDAPDIDDEVPNLVDDEEDEKDLDEAEIEEAEQVVEGKHSPHGTPKAEKDAQKVVELEDDEGSNSEPEVLNVEAEEAGPSAAKKSPTVTKRRVRRQD